MGRCLVTGTPTALMKECPEERWPAELQPEIKLLWLMGDVGKGGCSRYARDVLKILSPIPVEMVYFNKHFFDKHTYDQLCELGPVSFYDPETIAAKIAWADVVTSMNFPHHYPDQQKILAMSKGKLFGQSHGTCEYTHEVVGSHRAHTDYFMACSIKAGAVAKGANVLVTAAPIDWNRVTRQRSKEEAKRLFCKVGPETKIVTFAGRLSPEKNVVGIANLVKTLPKDVKLLVVGDGWQAATIIPQIQGILGDRLILRPWVDNPTTYLDASDVFVCLSSWEGLPLTLVEALCHGTPVVSTDVGAAYEYIIRQPGKLPSNAVFPPQSILDALSYNDPAQQLAVADHMKLYHSAAHIKEQWMQWLLTVSHK